MKKNFRYFPATIKQTKIEGPGGVQQETCTLYMGKGHTPHTYLRTKLSMKAIIRGRRATLPWRRIIAI